MMGKMNTKIPTNFDLRLIFKKTKQTKNKKNNEKENSNINKEYEAQPIWFKLSYVRLT
jgi:hypothetical protein